MQVRSGQQRIGVDEIVDNTAVSTHASPLNTTVCWVPSKVISDASSCRARSTPAWYGVAGSWVVDTTTTLPGPGEPAGCGVDVGGTGHMRRRRAARTR